MSNDKIIKELNDLISVNKDRKEGYEKAANELNEPVDARGRSMLLGRAHESRIFDNELSVAVSRLGGTPAEHTSASGKIFRMWMDLKTSFTGGSAKSVFELCEFGEDNALKAYDDALAADGINWPEDLLIMLTRHREIIQEAHNSVKSLRDSLEQEKVGNKNS